MMCVSMYEHCNTNSLCPVRVLDNYSITSHTVLLGTGGSYDILSRMGCLPCLIASVSVNSGRTIFYIIHNTQQGNNNHALIVKHL